MEEKYSVKQAREIYKNNDHKILNSNSDAFVSLSHIDKVYPNGVQAVYDFNLDIKQHDFVALVGPSGCGKSTTLRMVAGLEEISKGELYIDNVLSNYLPSKDRDIAMVFQSYALYPQLNVYDNIAFGLKIRGLDKKEIQERVFKAADILDLGKLLDRKPKELSGGQMQRVALGRAIVRDARLFLMDEPLSNLDAKLRVQMRSEIVRIHEAVGATTIYVTHDQTEAMTMANKIVVMSKGFIQQSGSPMEIYHNPKNLFVATFIGTPQMNLIDAIYCDGEITLNDGSKFRLNKQIKDTFNIYVNEQIQYLSSLVNDETITDSNRSNYLGSINAYSKEKMKSLTQENVKSKKDNLFKKIAKLFKKKQSNLLNNDFKAEINEMISKYQEALNNPFKVKIGLRSEHFAIGNEGICFHVDLVEMLGSEFILYGKTSFGDLVIKSNTNVIPHSDIYINFNIDKIAIFDSINEQNILFKN